MHFYTICIYDQSYINCENACVFHVQLHFDRHLAIVTVRIYMLGADKVLVLLPNKLSDFVYGCILRSMQIVMRNHEYANSTLTSRV